MFQYGEHMYNMRPIIAVSNLHYSLPQPYPCRTPRPDEDMATDSWGLHVMILNPVIGYSRYIQSAQD